MANVDIAQNDVDSLPEASSLWASWWNAFFLLRPAFRYFTTFLWFAVVVAGFTIGTDMLGGVTRIMRALQLQPRCYDSLLKHFHSQGVRVDSLATLWGTVVAPRLFGDKQVRVNGRRVFVGDGIKIPKRGKKMPGVKLVHQQSANKAEYTMAHSLQAVSMLVHAGESVAAVPLTARIHEGVVWCNAVKQTLLTKMLGLLDTVAGPEPYMLLADAYYAAGSMIKGLRQNGNHLITRMKSTAVAYAPHVHHGQRKRGRPRKYGQRIELGSLLLDRAARIKVASPVYGEKNVILEYVVADLLWKPAGQVVRFVAVLHPNRGCCVFMSTDTTLDPVEIIRLYGLRFKIEYSFKQAVHQIGAFAYRFWMQQMKPQRNGDGDQYVHRESPKYRDAMKRKLHAYHVFIHAGIIAQGLTQFLAAMHPKLVWYSFGSWLRTIRPGIAPSEFVVSVALRQRFPEFLLNAPEHHAFAKFIRERQVPEDSGFFRMVA